MEIKHQSLTLREDTYKTLMYRKEIASDPTQEKPGHGQGDR